MSDQSTWPEHLRDDAPELICTRCHRMSWASPHGEPCGMIQPDGSICPGRFVGKSLLTVDEQKALELAKEHALAWGSGWLRVDRVVGGYRYEVVDPPRIRVSIER